MLGSIETKKDALFAALKDLTETFVHDHVDATLLVEYVALTIAMRFGADGMEAVSWASALLVATSGRTGAMASVPRDRFIGDSTAAFDDSAARVH